METVADELRTDAFLSVNFEYLAVLDPPAITPVLPQLPGGAGPLPADFQLTSTEVNTKASIILQVNAVEDVSFPLAQRLRIMAGEEEKAEEENRTEMGSMTVEETLRSMEDNEPATQRRGRRQRLLRLTLTDGFTRVIAMEDCSKGCSALRNGVTWGAKLRLFAPLQVRHGVIILTSETTVMLGGFVPELQAFWLQYARAMLEKISGRPKKSKKYIEGNDNRLEATGAATSACFSSGVSSKVGNIMDSVSNTVIENNEEHLTNLQEMERQGQRHVVYPQPQPLSAWKSHYPPNSPFTTIAVISEVTSELTIRKDAVLDRCDSRKFSLLVLLSSPPPSTLTTTYIAFNGNAENAELVVDLGHDWLRQAIGMDIDAFSALSISRKPDDVARLNALVEAIGWKLENFGLAIFVLRQREVDQVVEVTKVTPLEATTTW